MTTTIDLRAYYSQDRHYTLEALDQLLPPLPPGRNGSARGYDGPARPHEGPFDPHHGEPLPDDVKERFLDYLKGLGLVRHSDGRYRGPCPFEHENGPSDGESSFYASPVSGTWHCFGSSHAGQRHGGIQSFRSLGFRVQLPRYTPDPEATRKLWAAKRGSPPEDKQGKEPAPESKHHYQGYVDDCWPIHSRRQKAAVQSNRPDRLTGEIKAHQKRLLSWARSEDAEFVYMTDHVRKLCTTSEDPHLNTPDLEPLVVAYFGEKDDYTGEEKPVVRRVRDCSHPVRAECSKHGPQAEWGAECRLGYCPHCLPDIARTVDRARLPDIDPKEGAAYRSVWLTGVYPLPEALPDWKEQLDALQKQWNDALTRIQRRKATNGIVFSRAFTAYYTLNEGCIHWKVMLRESAPGHADDAVAELCRVMDAEVYDDRRYVHGELATLQLIEDCRTHLLGFSPDIDWEEKFELFAAHLDATKGKHVFQTMGFLWELMEKAAAEEKEEKPEPMVCKVPGCGERLAIKVYRNEPAPGRGETTLGAVGKSRGPDPPASRQPAREGEAAEGGRPNYEGDYWEVVV